MMRKPIIYLLLLLLVFSLSSHNSAAQIPQGEEYTVQAGDWLSKIAEKYYGVSNNYPAIIDATNAKAAEDANFAFINDPNFIVVGQKLWVPRLNQADSITVGNLTFEPAAIDTLGIDTFVPQNWPQTNEDDPLLRHSWSAGIFSLVSFTTTPGNDAIAGLARLLGVNRVDLTEGFIGGELTEREIGDYTWSIFSRNEGGINSIVAATVQDKVIYHIRLLAESSQSETILSAILDNFVINNPAIVQQNLEITVPTAGTALTNPFELRGTTSQYPFKGRLIYRVLDAEGNQVGRAPFEVVGIIGNPATFAIPAIYSVNSAGTGTVEVAEVSETDGTIIAIDSVGVMLQADPDGYTVIIDDPRPYNNISSPVQIRGKTGDRPFEGRLNYRIVDANNQELSSGRLQSSGQTGEVNLFDGFAEYSISKNGPGRIEVYDIRPADGAVFSIGTVNVWLTSSP